MKSMFALLLATLGLAVVNHAHAQTWPAKPLMAVVPVGAGSLADTIARLVLNRLASQLGQPIVVENWTGAGGTIGAAFVAKSPADGYTLLVHSNAHTIAPALYPSLSYQPARDFAAVAPLGISPHVLVVSPSKGFKTVGDLIAAGKAKPGSLTFASVGVGTATHLSAERFRTSTGINAVHVPFRGGPASHNRSDGRTSRLLLRPAWAGAAANTRWQARRAGRERLRAICGPAECSDHCGSGPCQR